MADVRSRSCGKGLDVTKRFRHVVSCFLGCFGSTWLILISRKSHHVLFGICLDKNFRTNVFPFW